MEDLWGVEKVFHSVSRWDDHLAKRKVSPTVPCLEQ